MSSETVGGVAWVALPIATVATEARALARGATRPVILAIDGRSASGKSTIAAELAARLAGAPVIHTDDVAWHHSFFDWWPLMRDELLEPLRAGRPVAWRPPGWVARGRSGAIEVPASPIVLIEGVSASRQELTDLLDATVWVAGDMAEQERRGVLRDGGDDDAQRFWADWQAQERPLLAADRPWERADLLVLGTPVSQAPEGCWWAQRGPGGRLGVGDHGGADPGIGCPATDAFSYPARMELTVSGEIWSWRGPAPHHFVTVPAGGSRKLRAIASSVTYGWGMIPVSVRIGDTTWTTALWPKDGLYIVPLKLWVRKAERLELGDTVTIHLSVAV